MIIFNIIFIVLGLGSAICVLVGILMSLFGVFRGLFSKKWGLLIRGLKLFGIGIVISVATGFGYRVFMSQTLDKSPLYNNQLNSL